MIVWHTHRAPTVASLTLLGIVGLLARPCAASRNPKRPLAVPAGSTARTQSQPAALSDLLGSLPITFERNQGQAKSATLFLARAQGWLLQFRSGKVALTPAGNAASGGNAGAKPGGGGSGASPAMVRPSALSFSFIGSRRAQPEGRSLLTTKTNYYWGPSPSQQRTGIPNYGKLLYRDLYSGVDLIFHGEKGALEYDFVIAPGADPKKIRMKMNGAVKITPASGSMTIQTRQGELQLARPLAYQERNGVRAAVASDYFVSSGNVVELRLAAYDHSIPLIIDPVLDFATIFTAQPYTYIPAVGLDSAGDIYAAANYNSGQSSITRINANRRSVDFTTIMNGANSSNITAMAVDATGNAYVVGQAGSGLATTPGAFRTNCPSTIPDCKAPFVAKFNSSGSAVYSTYLSPGAVAQSVALDLQGDAYIAGDISFPGLDVVNAFESTYQGMQCTTCGNAFVQELNAAGSALLYSTYLAPIAGPTGVVDTTAVGIAVDSAGSAYVTGNGGTNFPTNNNSLTLNEANGFFVVKFKPDGSDLVYAAAIGGYTGGGTGGKDTSSAIAVDSQGSAYVTGVSSTVDFPVTPGAFLAACEPLGSTSSGGCGSSENVIFAAKLSPDGQSLDYATYIGAGTPYAMTVDPNGDMFITGGTAQTNFPTINATQAGIQVTPATVPIAADAFVTALDPSGSPSFSTFFGGIGTIEGTRGIAVDSSGEHVVIGGSFFPYGPALDIPLVGPLQTTTSGTNAGFVASFDLSTSAPVLSVSPRAAPFLALRNVGSAPLHISSMSTSDGSPLGGQCPTVQVLPAGTGCFLTAGGPNTTGSFELIVNDDAGSQSFAISEPPSSNPFGIQPFLATSAATLVFPTQLTGTISQPQSFTVTNFGTGSATGLSVSASGEIVQSNNCPGTLLSGASCTVQVISEPVDLNGGGSVTVTQGTATNFFQVFVPLTATTSALVASAQSINFGNQFGGLAYPSRTVVVRNAGPVAAGVGTVSAGAPFAQTNNCPASLGAGVECQIYVTFTPSQNGPATGSLTVATDAAGGSLSVSLNGTGLTNSPVSVSPSTLVFLGDITNLPDGPLALTIGNPSVSQPVSVASVSASPPQFAITANNCSGQIGPLGSCTVEVTFTAAASGTTTGTVTVTPSGAGAPQVVPVSGTANDVVQLTPSPLNVGDQEVGTTGPAFLADINNESGSAVTIESIAASGDFQVAQSCWATLPGQLKAFYGCALGVTFTPSMAGPRSGTLTVMASDSPTPHQMTINGNGVSGVLEVSPATVNFGYAIDGTITPAQSVALSNVSGAAVSLQSISVPAPFSQTNNCGSALAFGAKCKIQVQFSPATYGPWNSLLTVQGPGAPITVAVSGDGFSGAQAALSQTSVSFGDVYLGNAQPVVTQVSLGDPGTAALAISSISLAGADMAQYSESNNCPVAPATLAVGNSCTINISFQPVSAGAKNNVSVSVADSAAGTPQVIAVSGTGVDISLSPMTSQATVTAGMPAQFTINLGVSGGTTPNAIGFAASGLPTGATGSFNPAIIPAGSSASGTVFTISTTARNGTAQSPSGPPIHLVPGPDQRLGLLLVCALALLCVFRVWCSRSVWRLRLAGAFLFAALLGCSGGGGSGMNSTPPPAGTPAGTYSITVTATSGGAVRTTQLSITVQ